MKPMYRELMEFIDSYIDYQCREYSGHPDFEATYKLGYCKAMLAQMLTDKQFEELKEEMKGVEL